jgi:hypothetical protein
VKNRNSFSLFVVCAVLVSSCTPVTFHSDSLSLSTKARVKVLLEKRDELRRIAKLLMSQSRSGQVPSVANGRLTLVSNEPIPTSDVASASTLYYTPYEGDAISLYNTNTSKWGLARFSELSLVLSGLSGSTNYDVFLENSSGTLTLSAVAWPSNVRSAALAVNDGILTKSGDISKRYLGSFRALSSTTTCDSRQQRFLWNYYNRVRRYLYVTESEDFWRSTNTGSVYDYANANASNKVEFIIGYKEVLLRSDVYSSLDIDIYDCRSGAGMGLDGVISGFPAGFGVLFPEVYDCSDSGDFPGSTERVQATGYPDAGYHFVAWVEASTTNQGAYIGDRGNPYGLPYVQTGLVASIDG